MSKYRIFLFKEGKEEPEIKEISSEENISDFLKTEMSHLTSEDRLDELFMFKEDDDKGVSEETFDKAGIHEKHRIHCHRCKKVDVTVSYNGKNIHKHFPPSATGKTVFKWAVIEFSFPTKDPTNYELRVNDSTGAVLKNTDHIGIYVKYPNCDLHLYLVPKQNIQG